MKIIPFVLFLRIAKFLPNDCDAVINLELTGVIRAHTEHHTFQSQFIYAPFVPFWLEDIPSTVPDFDEYHAFVRFADNSMHISGFLHKKTPGEIPDRDHVPRSFEAEIRNVKYDCKETCHWETYDPASPPSRRISHLFKTIPHSKRVLYTVIGSEHEAIEAQKVEEILKNHDASAASTLSLRERVLRTLQARP